MKSKRIDYNNLYIIFIDRNGCTYEDLCIFDSLPYKHKVAFAKTSYPELKSVVHIKGFEDEPSVGLCMSFINKYSERKNYNQFDYVKWLNDKS